MFEQWRFPLTARALSCNAAANQRWRQVLGSIMKAPMESKNSEKSRVMSQRRYTQFIRLCIHRTSIALFASVCLSAAGPLHSRIRACKREPFGTGEAHTQTLAQFCALAFFFLPSPVMVSLNASTFGNHIPVRRGQSRIVLGRFWWSSEVSAQPCKSFRARAESWSACKDAWNMPSSGGIVCFFCAMKRILD